MARKERLSFDLQLAISNDSVDGLRYLYKPEFAESAFTYATLRNANKCLYFMFDVMKIIPTQIVMISLIINSRNVNFVNHLLISGVKLPNNAVSFALHNIKMLKLLLSHGADPNCESRRHGFESALNDVISYVTDGSHLSYAVDYNEIARHLIEAGARVSYMDSGTSCVIKIEQNMATKKKRYCSAMIAFFFTLKSCGVPRDLIRFMAKLISWKNECWLNM